MDTHQPLHGRLEDVHFSELLLTISQRKETGLLHVTRYRIEKDVYFQDGRIVFAKSNDPDERLGELLLRAGKITYKQLDDSSRKVMPGLRLGTILVQEGYLKASDLYQGVIDQVEAIVYSLFDWSEGTFEFHSGDLPTKEVITLSISTPDIILAGINRVWRWSWVRDWVGSLDTVYERKAEWNGIIKKMSVTPGIQSLIDLLEKPMTLEEILNTSRINNFETSKLVWALLIIGVIQPGTPQLSTLEMPFEPEITSDIFLIEPPEEAESNEEDQDIENAEKEEPASRDETPRIPVKVLDPEPAAGAADVEDTSRLPSITDELASSRVEPPIPEKIAPPSSVFQMEINSERVLSDDTPVELSFSDLADIHVIPAAPQTFASSNDGWEKNVERDIKNFNEIHRFIFEMLRMEMGAGAGNFLNKIFRKAATQYPFVFEGVNVNEFGELDSNSLAGNIQGNYAELYSEAFDFLLQEERNTMQSILEKKRMEAIESGINRIIEKQRSS